MHEGPTENRLGELGSLYKYYYYYYYYQCHTAPGNSFGGLISLVRIARFVVVVKLLGAMCY